MLGSGCSKYGDLLKGSASFQLRALLTFGHSSLNMGHTQRELMREERKEGTKE